MVYPTFTIQSIQTRCGEDIQQFLQNNQIAFANESLQDIASFGLYTESVSGKKDMLSVMDPLMAKMIDISGKDLSSFDYAHDVAHLSLIQQQRLWIMRTYVFYQLLLFVTRTFQNEALYGDVYTDVNKYPYRSDIRNDLEGFKMGIFGSITPTSDIDIGIQYSGQKLNVPGLAYVVSRFENIFITLTSKNSLEFDIETYADMMTIPNLGPDKNTYPDYFYLDTSNFETKHFHKVLVCAGTSILRNEVLAKMDLQGRSLTTEEIQKALDGFNNDNMLKLQPSFAEFYTNIQGDLTENWLKEASPIVLDYMSSSYDDGRYKYYEHVDVAEKSKFTALQGGVDNLSTDQICDIMTKIGMALTYRMESYTCAPSVIHVVRILQASKEKAEKYKTLAPKSYCLGNIIHLDPFCSLGKYGYALSCLEQMGYVNRFYYTYCEKTDDTSVKKCKKKMDKYMGRFSNGKLFFDHYITGQQQGGIAASVYRNNRGNSRSSKKTKRHTKRDARRKTRRKKPRTKSRKGGRRLKTKHGKKPRRVTCKGVTQRR